MKLTKHLLCCLTALTLANVSAPLHAQTYNPQSNWKDSYAVDGTCYCDSNGYDHGLDTKTVMTPKGRKGVVEVCTAIKAALGTGRATGRVPYNDIQCGNGPANDAADEAGCPGRVDIGPAGCNQKGPMWDLARVYGGVGGGEGTSSGNLPRDSWRASASSGDGVASAFDGSTVTRWATGATQRPGQYFQMDLGKLESFDGIELNAGEHPFDYPRAFEVWVSDDANGWRGPVAQGKGDRTITDIDFPRQTARFVRINQTGSDDQRWWSIAEVKLQLTGATDSTNALDPRGWSIFASSDPVNTRFAVDGQDKTRWSTQTAQRPGQFLQIDMLQVQRFNKIVLEAQESPLDYPRGYSVYVSMDGVKWESPVLSANGSGPTTTIMFAPREARHIRIEQTGSDKFYWWSIHELTVFKAN